MLALEGMALNWIQYQISQDIELVAIRILLFGWSLHLPFGIQYNSLNPIPIRMYKRMAMEFGHLQELQPLLALLPLRAKLR